MSTVRRVVIDTSTLISAMLRPTSAPRQAVLAAVSTYDLCSSLATLSELEDVLSRQKFNRYLPLQERLDFLGLITERSHIWDVDQVSRQAAAGACRDPNDDKFLALALACEASALVSSDADLLVMQAWHGVQILTPSAFVELAL